MIRNSLNQVLILTISNMKSRYRKTIAGFFWVIANPILMFFVQSTVFKKILNIQITGYSVFLLGGLLPWIFIVSTLDMCATILLNNGEVLRSYNINPTVIVLSQVLDNLINFLAAFFILLIVFALLGNIRFAPLLLFPLSLSVLAIFVFSISWIVSILQVFYRDIKFIIQFGTSILYFLTPIFYPQEMVPQNLQYIIELNPLYILISPIRSNVYNFTLDLYVAQIIKAMLVSGITLLIARKLWDIKKNEFYQFLR